MLATIVFGTSHAVRDTAVVLAVFLQALLYLAIGAGAVVVVVSIPVTFWLGLALTVLFAAITYPRSKAVRK